MASLRADALRWVSHDFPGFVELALTDAAGRVWHLVDKPPVFGDDRLTAGASYPFEVGVPCDVLARNPDGTLRVALQHGVEADDGTSEFVVADGQVDSG